MSSSDALWRAPQAAASRDQDTTHGRLWTRRLAPLLQLGSENYVETNVDLPVQTPRQACVYTIRAETPAHSCDLRIGVAMQRFT